MLFLSLAVGWFTGWMLLHRTVRIMNLKRVLGCIVLLIAMGASLVLTRLDPLGIASWVPRAENVRSVTLANHRYDSTGLTVTDQEQIGELLEAHRAAIREPDYFIADESVPDTGIASFSFSLTYELTNGTTAQRTYDVYVSRECAGILKPYFSSPAFIFGLDGDLDTLAGMVEEVYLEDVLSDPGEIRSLVEAILKDCETGSIAQVPAYHENRDTLYWLSFAMPADYGADSKLHVYRSLEVYEDSVHTVQWLRERGLLEEIPASKFVG